MLKIWNDFLKAVHLAPADPRPNTSPHVTSATSTTNTTAATTAKNPRTVSEPDAPNQPNPSQAARHGKRDRFRFLKFHAKRRKQDAAAARSSAPATNPHPHPSSGTAAIPGNPNASTPADAVRSRRGSGRPATTMEDHIGSAVNVLNTIQQTDWDEMFQRIESAIKNNHLGDMGQLLYSSALRRFPLPAKSMLRIAQDYPQELENPAFRKVCQIAFGLDADTIPAPTTPTDPVFNPADLLAGYYSARSNEANAAHAAHAEGANRSGRERQPSTGSGPPGGDTDLRSWTAVNEKWMVIYDLKAAIQASLEKTRLLSDAIAAYERSRSGG